MVKISKIQFLTYALPFLVILTSVFVGLSSLSKTHPDVTSLLAYDLAVLSPLLYFLLIRKRKISKLTVIPFITVGIVITTFLLPENQHNHLHLIKAIVIPSVEIFLVATILRNIYIMSKSVKTNSLKIDDAYMIIKRSSIESFGNSKFMNFLISEMGVFYYAAFAWKKKVLDENEFSNYKDNGTVPMIWALIFIVFIETAALHFLVAKWSFIGAWILTILSIYTAFMLFGHLKAMSRRPSIITNNKVVLKNGLLASITINLKDIERVEIFNGQISESDKVVGNLGLAKESNDHNVALYFSQSQTIEKFYGITQRCDRLLFFIDDKNNFVQELKSRLD